MQATDHVCLEAAKAHRKLVNGASTSSQWHSYGNDRFAYMDVGNGSKWIYDQDKKSLWIHDPIRGMTPITNNADLDVYRRSRRNLETLERMTNDSH